MIPSHEFHIYGIYMYIYIHQKSELLLFYLSFGLNKIAYALTSGRNSQWARALRHTVCSHIQVACSWHRNQLLLCVDCFLRMVCACVAVPIPILFCIQIHEMLSTYWVLCEHDTFVTRLALKVYFKKQSFDVRFG